MSPSNTNSPHMIFICNSRIKRQYQTVRQFLIQNINAKSFIVENKICKLYFYNYIILILFQTVNLLLGKC